MKNVVEEWRTIPGHERYEVSNLGRVRSKDHIRMKMNAGKLCSFSYKGKVLKLDLLPNGYLSVMLMQDGKRYKVGVHRLVALAFLPNPNNYNVVNHKDECKTNNCVENLEWCTQQYNVNYGAGLQKRSESLKRHLSTQKNV